MSYQLVDDSITDFGSIVSQELATAIKTNIDYVQKSFPIGWIMPIFTGIAGVGLPNPNVWQECNGSEIVNPNSPLRSTGDQKRYAPSIRGRYVRGASVVGESGTTSGSNSASLSHSHKGVTKPYVTPENADDGSFVDVAFYHDHPISSDLTNPISLEPPYYTIKFYIKIQ